MFVLCSFTLVFLLFQCNVNVRIKCMMLQSILYLSFTKQIILLSLCLNSSTEMLLLNLLTLRWKPYANIWDFHRIDTINVNAELWPCLPQLWPLGSLMYYYIWFSPASVSLSVRSSINIGMFRNQNSEWLQMS